jgi:hypothetical protein
VSRGPGRVMLVILEAIADPDASVSFDLDGDYLLDGPVGVPRAVIYKRLYGAHEPTRAQFVSTDRAIRQLAARGLVGTYTRRTCPLQPEKVTRHAPWNHELRRFDCDCGTQHRPEHAVGRPRNDAEEQRGQQRMAAAMAKLRQMQR